MTHSSHDTPVITEEPLPTSDTSIATLAAENDRLRQALDDASTRLEFKTRALRILMIPQRDPREG